MNSPTKVMTSISNLVPEVLAVGPQRTASSWLEIAMREHPRLIFPTNVKETFFFDRYYDRGVKWYLSHFEQHSKGILKGEVGSTYFESWEARERIRETNPDAKIIITVRNPIARSFSSFRHERTKGRVGDDFFEAVQLQPRIVASGHYGVLAPEWEATFGREHILYIVQEDIETDPQGQLDAICDFLDVERAILPEKLYSKYGQGTVPRFQLIASLASRLASLLRKTGFHRIVETGKKLGLKKVYSGGNQDALSLTRPVYDYLATAHEEDIRFLENRLGRSFAHWRSLSTYGLEA